MRPEILCMSKKPGDGSEVEKNRLSEKPLSE